MYSALPLSPRPSLLLTVFSTKNYFIWSFFLFIGCISFCLCCLLYRLFQLFFFFGLLHVCLCFFYSSIPLRLTLLTSSFLLLMYPDVEDLSALLSCCCCTQSTFSSLFLQELLLPQHQNINSNLKRFKTMAQTDTLAEHQH